MTLSYVYRHATLATMTDGYGLIKDAALAVADGKIAWIGADADLPDHAENAPSQDLKGRLITPGLVDCHTHLVFGGSRANEFEKRMNGVSYEEIARAGGGIRSTVKATRETSEEDLLHDSQKRLDQLLREGVTTIEIKSGYGLDLDTELKMLRVARKLGESNPITVRTTYLGAHALPPEYNGDKDAYISFICEQALPAVAQSGLADAVDAFCEGIGFSPQQVERVFEAAQKHNLPVKLHAEQLSDLSGAALAARYDALSADHLEFISEDGVKAMAEAGTVAVLLPGAFYYLRETQRPPIDLFRKHAVPMALATDCNPGSSPCTSLLLMLNMGCTFFNMTPLETLSGITRHGAKALGLADEVGSLAVGKQADLVVWDQTDPGELSYRFGFNPCLSVMKGGKILD